MFEQNLFPIDQGHLEMRAVIPQVRKGLPGLDHGAHGQGLQAIEIGQAGSVGMIGPLFPGARQEGAHLWIGMLRTRLQAGPHQGRHYRSDGRCGPGVVPHRMRRAVRGGVGSRQNGRVEIVQGLGIRPAPSSPGGIEAAGNSQG